MEAFIAFFQNLVESFNDTLMNPEWIIKHGGLYLVAFIIFAETGLFIGFFLPGDGLLFITGIIIANSTKPFMDPLFNLFFWLVVITVCAIIGNMVGYWFGKKSGPMLYKRKESWIFKKKYLDQAAGFYEKRGGAAIIVARFLPIVRTFAPIVGGIVKMDRKKFMRYNILGAVVWVFSITTVGYVLGNNAWVGDNLHFIVLGIVLVTTAPVLYKMISGKNAKEQKSNKETTDTVSTESMKGGSNEVKKKTLQLEEVEEMV